MPKGAVSIGFDIDSQSIRAAKVMCTGSGKDTKVSIVSLEEITGSFVKDEDIVEGLKKLKQKISLTVADNVVTCVGGKQTYVAQLAFRKLPEEEMKTALKFEIRKNLPFDTAGASLEYQFLKQPEKKSDTAPLIVTSVATVLLQRYLRLFDKAGIQPAIIDVFPLTLANAFRACNDITSSAETSGVILHIGSDYSTVVIDGDEIPFFNRTIYFAAAQMFGNTRDENLAPKEIERMITSFTEEISRSLTYYETTYRASTPKTITVVGSYSTPELLDVIARNTRLAVNNLELVKRIDPKRAGSDKFDIAVTLGMRD